jgi:hypothetical protein
VGVDISVFLILGFGYKLLILFDGFIYTGGDGLGFLLAEALRHRNSGRNISVEKNTGRTAINYFESGYADTAVPQRELGVIYHRQKFRPVILIVIYEEAEALIYILIYNLRLVICLRVISGGEFQFNI